MIKENCGTIYLPDNQSENADKLLARQAIYCYSLRKDNIWKWTAKKYPIFFNERLIEVVCRNRFFGIFVSDYHYIFLY